MRVDHVVYGVTDLAEAAARLETEHGLRFISGGRHPGGTVNSVAPLAPPQYLELLAVEEAVDDDARAAQELIADGKTLLAWAVSVDDIDQVAARTGRPIVAGAIRRTDGSTGSWRTIGSGEAPWLPFFIAYDGDPAERRASWARRRAEAGNERFGGFVRVQVGGDEAELRDWLGEGFEGLPVEVVAGEAGLRTVAITSPGGEVVLSDRSATGWTAL